MLSALLRAEIAAPSPSSQRASSIEPTPIELAPAAPTSRRSVCGCLKGKDLLRRTELRGDDLHTNIPVALTGAVLGTEVEVPTLSGKVALKIPPETQNGKSFRLRGKGMPRLKGGGAGDLYAKVFAQLPANLSERERALFQELQELRG